MTDDNVRPVEGMAPLKRSWVLSRPNGVPIPPEAQVALREGRVEIWANSRYQVQVMRLVKSNPTAPDMVWLSIKRRDKQPIHDWRELQALKNALVGPECEGVELYPAESRKVDTANQFHLWVIADPTFRWPFGHKEREVGTPEEAAQEGAVQRPFVVKRKPHG